MKRLLVFMALASCAVAGTWIAGPGKGSHAAAAASATDDFNRANADPIGGNWVTVTGNGAFKIVSNCCSAFQRLQRQCGIL